jgi:HK97 family phage major capsid protein
VSDKKFAIETEADIGKGFETLDGELGDLKKKSEELVARIDSFANVDDRLAEVTDGLKSLREDFKKASSKLVTRDGLPATPLPCSAKEFAEFGWKAVYGGKSKIAYDRRTGDIETDGPIAQMQQAGDEMQIVAAVVAAQKGVRGQSEFNPRGLKFYDDRWVPAFNQASNVLKAAITETTTDPGVGDWVPQTMSPQMDALLSLNQRLLSFIRSINMPRSPFLFPRQVGRTAHGYRASTGTVEATGTRTVFATDVAGTTEMSDNVQFDGRRIWGLATIADDGLQDSIVALIPFYRSDMIESLARQKEDAFMNGDRTATHQDADVTGGDDHRKAWYGLRYYGLANSTTQKDASGAVLDSNANWGDFILGAIAEMGTYGDVEVFNGNPDDLVIPISGKEFWGGVLQIDQFRMMNTYGSNATITGVNANVGFKPDGCWLVVSEMARHDLAATGVYTTAGNSLTMVPVFNRRAWVEGVFQGMRVRTFDDSNFAIYGQMGVMLDWRGDVQAIKGPQAEAATQKHTVGVINVA